MERKRGILSKTWNVIWRKPMKKLKNAYLYFFDIILKVCIYLPSFKSEKMSLLIVDNFEPSPLLTGFRVTEFNWLLNSIHNSKLLTFSRLICKYSDFKKQVKRGMLKWNNPYPFLWYRHLKKNYIETFHLNKDQLIFMTNQSYTAKGAYLMFIYNAYLTKNFLEKNEIPFVFTLFPGGGLRLNHPFSDHMLKTVFGSPMFRGVFVPQKIIYDYLLEKQLCPKEKMYFSYGGGFFQFKKNDVLPKLWYKKDKDTFDVGFVAYRYMKQGKDKGFDLVVHTAKELVKKYPFIHFHCVGTNTLKDFDEDFSDIAENLHIYPSQKPEFFPEFFQKMDMILSPNRPNLLDKGAFDGFPLTSEAGFFGVPLFCTDELNMNYNYEDKKELVVVKPDVSDIIYKVEYYLNHLDELMQVGMEGQKKIQAYFDIDYQKSDRKKFIQKFLDIDFN